MTPWWRLIIGPARLPSFDRDLELLVAGWTDRSRKRELALSPAEIAAKLRAKAGQLDRAEVRP